MFRTQDYRSYNSIINATDVCQTLLQLHTKMKNKYHKLNSIILKYGNAPQMSGSTECHVMGGSQTSCSSSSSPMSIIKWVSVEHTSYNFKPVSTNPQSITTDWLMATKTSQKMFYFLMNNLHNMLEAGFQKSLHIPYAHDWTGIIAHYNDTVMNVTTNSPLFILFTTLWTPPIWSWCQCVTTICSKSMFSSFRTSSNLFIYCRSSGSPASNRTLLNTKKSHLLLTLNVNYIKARFICCSKWSSNVFRLHILIIMPMWNVLEKHTWYSSSISCTLNIQRFNVSPRT